MPYLTNFDKVIRDERQMKALIGMDRKTFEFLIPYFKETSEQIKKEEFLKRGKRGKKRRRLILKPQGKFNTYEKQLFFLLSYYKIYPTFDVHGANFGIRRTYACDKVHEFTPVLVRTLRNLGVAPKREIKSAEDFKEVFGEGIDKLLVDVTERRYFRHKNYRKQKRNYSGKKNSTQRRIY